MSRIVFVKRCLVVILGLCISGVGIGLYLFARLGMDPASVFELGVGSVLHVSYGTASALLNIVILAVVFLIDRRYVNVASIFAIFLLGYTGQATAWMLEATFGPVENLLLRGVVLIVAVGVMALGIPIYIRAKLGVGAIDLLSEIISDRSGWNYRWVRIAGDTTFVVVGWFLGGTVGIGTLIAAFGLGPIVSLCRPRTDRLVDRFLAVEEAI